MYPAPHGVAAPTEKEARASPCTKPGECGRDERGLPKTARLHRAAGLPTAWKRVSQQHTKCDTTMLAPKVKGKKPQAGPSLDPEMGEVLTDALDSRHKSTDAFKEDLVDAFNRMPPEAKASAAAICRDMGNEAVKSERWEEAVEHYTSVLSAYPHDHEVPPSGRQPCSRHP